MFPGSTRGFRTEMSLPSGRRLRTGSPSREPVSDGRFSVAGFARSGKLEKGVPTVNDVSLGINIVGVPAPTLRSVRRMPNLERALREVSRRPVGCDGIRWESFADPLGYVRWDPNLLDLSPELQPLRHIQERIAHSDEPDPVEEILVDGRRLVQRGTVWDRVIQRAIARKLLICFDPCFAPGSWGYRPVRSPERAIVEVRNQIRAGAHWAFRTDIQRFFHNVNRDILAAQLRAAVPDQSLCEYLLRAISPMVLSRRGSGLQHTGLPEGNGVTPFLANLHLHGLDVACSGLAYFRYVDDILVLGRTLNEVLQANAFIKLILNRFHLRLNEEKTYIRDLYREPVVFLGYELRGGNVYPPEQAIARFREKLTKFRGQEARRGLMVGFVRRFGIGPVRKLFRRLDRELVQLYPPGLSLVGLLEE